MIETTETAGTAEVLERPILFAGPMVMALLEGKKSQTRRSIRGVYRPTDNPHLADIDCIKDWDGGPSALALAPKDWEINPFGLPGDRLWVKETFRPASWSAEGGWGELEYRAGGRRRAEGPWTFSQAFPADRPVDRWRPSIHMPRWASRITLEIAEVRVQRLQDISEEDAFAEGVGPGYVPNSLGSTSCVGYRPMFARVWNEINGKGSWDLNSWVWVISFRRL